MRSILARLALIVVTATSALADPSTARELVSENPVTSVHRLDGIPAPGKVSLLTHEEMSGTATIYELTGKRLEKRAEVSVPDRIWSASPYIAGDLPKIAYVTGYGRKNLRAPIRVQLAGAKMESPEQIYELTSERSEATFVRQAGVSLLVNLFESKYYTKLLELSPARGAPWSVAEKLRIRLGAYVDTHGSDAVIGRPYGDELGQDGDAKLLAGGGLTLLPSYRGVSSVRFAQLDDDSATEILIGDGWHQDYGKLAQGRLSLLDRDDRSGRYALQIVELDESQYAFTRIDTVRWGGKLLVVAGGPEKVRLFDPSSNWSSRTLYQRSSEGTLLDFAVLGADEDALYLAISDGKLYLERIGE